MFKEKKISIVVPAHNEQKLIQKVLKTLPHWIDYIFVIDDCSTDATSERVRERMGSDPRIQLIRHEINQGVGAAICSGYKASLKNEVDIAVVMAGDAQMDPDNLESLILPVAEEGVDYTKGNRLFEGRAWEIIPHHRYIGNSILSLLTKIASGYWHIADTQCGYTAISKKAMHAVDLDKVYPRYGMPNDLLVKLNVADCTVRDVPVQPIYNIGEVSGIRISRVVIAISRLLLSCFFRRLIDKYVIRDFHPLVFFYTLGLIAFPAGLISGMYLFLYRLFSGPVATTSALFSAFLIISGLQFLLFAMWFDMENNKSLKG
ncbi:MAG: glycosyltransferase family 2 protein [Nitrospinae bacterium]|nr:glycosyltransferase family 2 protein [Nitrospinota bacterium]MZH13763.1 glycosyltransferase family 2 protein [Nitrospinota bacterium]